MTDEGEKLREATGPRGAITLVEPRKIECICCVRACVSGDLLLEGGPERKRGLYIEKDRRHDDESRERGPERDPDTLAFSIHLSYAYPSSYGTLLYSHFRFVRAENPGECFCSRDGGRCPRHRLMCKVP